MKPLFALLLLTALAACGADDATAYPHPGCRAAMFEDTNVRQQQRAVLSPNAGPIDYQNLEKAKAAAYEKCTGITNPRRGGVQKVT